MTDKPDDPTDPSVPEQTEQRLREDVGGTVDFDGTSYKISPTAFRSHYQVMTADGRLLGLIEAVESPTGGRTFTARPATGAGMTQQLMIKIADAAAASGIIR
jgi:hypothetical protein